jgi:putative membrane protein
MSLKQVILTSGLVAALGAPLGARQATPPAPQPAQPQPSDPAKPVGPPAGKAPSSIVPRLKLDSPSKGAAKEEPASETSASPAAADFLRTTAKDGRLEIDLARLAVSKTSSAALKSYAEMLIADHEKAGDEVASIAAAKNVTLPKDLPGAPNAAKTHLEKLRGAVFDRAYAAAMVDGHKKAVAELERAINLSDPDVKNFAQETLPTLKHHLEEAQKLAK